jgi:hypothetical protein
VYEFFPADAGNDPEGPDLLRADQLEKGRRYFIYVTTSGGLYRYDMNDIIEVGDVYESTPLIRFVQKGKGVVSFKGEKLYEAQVVAAVHSALAPYAGRYEFITALGEMQGEQPRYSFLVEFETVPPVRALNTLACQIDNALCAENTEYAAKRASGRIHPPALRVIKPGEFARYRRDMIQEGKRDAQFKTVRLTSDSSLVKSLATECEVFASAQ